MKKINQAKAEVKSQYRRARLWQRIKPISQIVSPRAGVIHHAATAY